MEKHIGFKFTQVRCDFFDAGYVLETDTPARMFDKNYYAGDANHRYTSQNTNNTIMGDIGKKEMQISSKYLESEVFFGFGEVFYHPNEPIPVDPGFLRKVVTKITYTKQPVYFTGSNSANAVLKDTGSAETYSVLYTIVEDQQNLKMFNKNVSNMPFYLPETMIPKINVYYEQVVENAPDTGGASSSGGGRSGRGGRSYRVDNDLPVSKGSSGQLVKDVQKALAGIKDSEGKFPYGDILAKGSSRYGRIMNVVDAVDGKYGPRTVMAIKAFYKSEKQIDAPFGGAKIDQDVYDTITKFTGTSNVKAADVAAAMKDEGSSVAESISYQKDLLGPSKKRNKIIENLVFERLVKGCK